LISSAAFGQTKSDVFKEDVASYLAGFGFYKHQVDRGSRKYGSESDVRHLLEAWNTLIITEPDKFDIAKASTEKS
jgi:hypothetical protein